MEQHTVSKLSGLHWSHNQRKPCKWRNCSDGKPQTHPHWRQHPLAHRKSCKEEPQTPSYCPFPCNVSPSDSKSLFSLLGFIWITSTPCRVCWSLGEGGGSIFVPLRRDAGRWLEGSGGWCVGVIVLQRERPREVRSNRLFCWSKEKILKFCGQSTEGFGWAVYVFH